MSAAEHDDPPAPRRRRLHRTRRYAASLDTTALAVATLAALASLTPSLIPRTWAVQGVVTGLCAVSGYGVGALLGWVGRGLGLHLSAPGHRGFRAATAVAGVVGGVWLLVLGSGWQDDIRDLFGVPHVARWTFVGVPFVAVVLFVVVLWVARRLRALARRIGRWVAHLLPVRVAKVVGAVVVAWVTVGIATGVLWSWVQETLDAGFAVAAAAFDPGSEPPTSSLRSGSSASDVSWESLGREGRRFVTRGASDEQIAAFAGGSAVSPIRVYAGLDSVDGGVDDAARLVVDELDRTDAWDRQVLLVVCTTGSGWVDPAMADSIELMYGGDTAVAALQYSYLPSWLSFLADRQTPADAGRSLFQAVYAAWLDKPADHRPKLLVSGISLGSYGMQSAFGGPQDLAARTDGALFLGTPYFAPMWTALTDARDPGSTQVSPVVDDGAHVRFLTGPAGTVGDPLNLAGPWGPHRVVYAQHGSDGIMWWAPALLWEEPDWLRERAARDVLPQVRWYPVVTFWQVAFDLFGSGGANVPPGFGHQYEKEYANGFAAVLPPDGWTTGDTVRLRGALPVTSGSSSSSPG